MHNRQKTIIAMMFLFSLSICVFISGCVGPRWGNEAAGTGTWTTNKPDKDESISEGFDYQQDNNNFLESTGDRFFMYYVSTTPYDGWKDSDPDAAYFMGPVISATSGPVASTIFTPSEGAIMWREDRKQFYGYDGSAWFHGGNRPPAYDNSTLFPACDTDTIGTMLLADDNDTLFMCVNKGAGDVWEPVASNAAAGVSTIAADVGGSASGAITIAGGTGMSTSLSGSTVTLNWTGSDNGTKTENIQSVSCGNTYCPITQWVGDDDFDGVNVMWFSSSTKDQVTFQWRADPILLISSAVTITAYCIIEDTPDDSNDQVVLNYRLSGGGGGSYYTFADNETVTLRSGGSNLWTPFTTGTPYSVYETVDMRVTPGTVQPDDIVTFSIAREVANALDDFGYDFGIFHFAITYGL